MSEGPREETIRMILKSINAARSAGIEDYVYLCHQEPLCVLSEESTADPCPWCFRIEMRDRRTLAELAVEYERRTRIQ